MQVRLRHSLVKTTNTDIKVDKTLEMLDFMISCHLSHVNGE